MGCAGSKLDVQETVTAPGEIEVDIASDSSISQLKAKIKELDKLKLQYNELFLEQAGVTKLLDDTRDELLSATTEEAKAKEDYNFLLRYAMERDADDVYRAMQNTLDKQVLIDILTARTKWQLEIISNLFEQKHGVPLKKEMQRTLTTLTGNQSGLGRLLTWVSTDQPERDAQVLSTHIKDMDVVSTRTNKELRGALECFKLTHNGKDLLDIIRPKTYKNFGNLLEKCLECRRDESGCDFEIETASRIAAELEEAFRKKDADAYIRIFANMSFEQFESLNAVFRNGGVVDTLRIFSGDFASLLLARCTNRLHYLCFRLSSDKEAIPRILGCLSRKDCQALRQLFDDNRNEFGQGKSLTEILHEIIHKESYLTACMNLISDDPHVFPLGVDREAGEDEAMMEQVGLEAMEKVMAAYNEEDMRNMGETEIRKKGIELERSRTKLSFHMSKKLIMEHLASVEEEKAVTKKQIEELTEQLEHSKDLYFTVFKHLTEVKEWTELYKIYVEMLNKHIALKDSKAARAVKKKGKNSD